MTQHGFTLIEIACTLAIIAILATLAYPQYQYTVARSRRRQAAWQLKQLANRLEYHQLHHLGLKSPNLPLPQVPGYQLKTHRTSSHQYRLIATPTATQAQYDRCGRLELTGSLCVRPKNTQLCPRCL